MRQVPLILAIALTTSVLAPVAMTSSAQARVPGTRPAAATAPASSVPHPGRAARPALHRSPAAAAANRVALSPSTTSWMHNGKLTTLTTRGLAGTPRPAGKLKPVSPMTGGATAPTPANPVPVVRAPDWNVQIANTGGSQISAGASMAYLPGTTPTDVLFGGFGPFGRVITASNTTMTWNGDTWASSLSTGPAARGGAMMAYDPAIGKIVLYGGWNGTSTFYSDTWTFDGTTWTQLTPTASPGPQAFGSMSYDTALGKLVLFGGASTVGAAPAFRLLNGSPTGTATASNQTWTFDGTTWTQLTPATSPAARFSSAMAYDQAAGNLILFGGYGGSGTLGDTWRFNGTTWTQLTPANAPVGVSDASMAYDPTLSSIVLFGGMNSTGTLVNTTSSWDAAHSSWEWASNDVAAPSRYAAAVAPAATNGQLVLYGGETGPSTYDSSLFIYDWGHRGSNTGDQTYDVTVNDRLNLSVDVGSGNLYLKQAGINLVGTGVNLETFAQYNSQTTAGVTDSVWPMTLHFGPAGSMEIDGVGGSDDAMPFYPNGSGGFTSPASLNATLQYVSPASGYELLMNAPSQQIYWFSAPADDGSGNPGLLTSITDHSGNTVSISGSLSTGNVSVLDTRGRTVTRSVASGTTTWTVPDGRTWTESAISAGWQDINDPDLGTTQLGYGGPNGMLSDIVDPGGRHLQISYDGYRRVASITRLLSSTAGPTVSFHWNIAPVGGNTPTGIHAHLQLQRTDSNGHLETYLNAYNGLTVGSVDPLGHGSSASYNADLSPVTQTDPLGNTANATYAAGDPTVQLTSSEPASTSGQTPAGISATYNTASSVLGYQHLASSTIDTQGNCTAKLYDPAGQLTDSYSGQASPCDGLTAGTHISTRYQGDAGVTSCGGRAGEVCSRTDGNGQLTSYSYDSAGNLTSMTPPTPLHASTYTYDSASRLATITDGTGLRTMVYDNEDRVTEIHYAGTTGCTPSAGTCVSYFYDVDGNRYQMKDKSGITVWAYDALNRMVKETPPNGPLNTCSSPNDTGVVYSYDEDSNLISMCSASGTTNYAYDSNGKLLATAPPITQVGLSHLSLPSSSSTVNLPAEIRANDQILVTVTTVTAATVTMPTGYNLVSSRSVSSLYEAVYSKTASSSDTSVLIGAPSYSQVTIGLFRGVSTSSPIDAVSAANTSSYTNSLTVPGVTTTAASDKLLLVVAGDGPIGSTNTEYTLSANLDSDQAYDTNYLAILGSQTRTSAGATGSQSVTLSYSQNIAAVLLALKPADAVSVPTTYGYDADGNRLSTNYPDGVSQNMTYNGASQLVSINAIKNSTSTTILNYQVSWAQGAQDRSQRQSITETVSGRTTTYTYDRFNRLTEAKDTAGGTNDYLYSYDSDGNLTRQTRNGSVLSAAFNSVDELCWTLTSASSNSCAGAPAGSTTYGYDSTGNLSTSTAGFAASNNSLNQTSSITAPGGSATAMTYSGEDQSNRTKTGTANVVNADDKVISAGPTGSVVSFVNDPSGAPVSETAASATYYYLFDALGSVVGLTDSSGTRQATYSYDPYGNTTSSGSAAAGNPFRYETGYQDATKLYHFGARYYDPGLGRWSQTDPTAQDPGYVYAGDDPINSADPSGTTNNANGRACSWWGCDFRLNNSRAHQLVDLLNVGAGAAAVCGVISAASGGGAPLALICGIVSGVLWAFSGYINWLEDRWNRGIYFRVYWWGNWYVWHQ